MKKYLLKRKIFPIIFALVMAFLYTLSFGACFGKNNDEKTPAENPIVKEYDAFIKDLNNFPISFTYGDRSFNGFDTNCFTELSRTSNKVYPFSL